MKIRDDNRRAGRNPRGHDPKPPSQNPPDKAQYNFTDPDSRIMKAGQSTAYEQSYNMRRMFNLVGEKSLPQAGWLHSYGF
jgi:hypothetical protein